MVFYKWNGKFLKKGGAFAVSDKCCCAGYYCVLTRAGKYECRNQRPDPASGDQVLSEHKSDTDCKKSCYERYYCTKDPTDPNAASVCVKEGDLKNGPNGPDVTGGPYPKSECEASCTTCPPCAEEACITDREGDAQPYNDCCAQHTEVWEYDGTDWVLKTECAEGGMCSGTGDPPFPNNPNAGDTHSFDCAPSGKDPPRGNPDCKECKYNCSPKDPADPEGEKECKRAKDGKLTQQKCEDTCLGKWHCVATDKCERQQNPDPASQGYDTEQECLDAAPVDCEKNFWYCETTDRCVERGPQAGEPDGYDNEPDCLAAAPTDCKPPEERGSCCVRYESDAVQCEDGLTADECDNITLLPGEVWRGSSFDVGRTCEERNCVPQQQIKQCYFAETFEGAGGGFWAGGVEGGICSPFKNAASEAECEEGNDDRPEVLPYITWGYDACIEVLKKAGWCCCGNGGAGRVLSATCDFWNSFPDSGGCTFKGEGTGLWGDPPNC